MPATAAVTAAAVVAVAVAAAAAAAAAAMVQEGPNQELERLGAEALMVGKESMMLQATPTLKLWERFRGEENQRGGKSQLATARLPGKSVRQRNKQRGCGGQHAKR
mmetsp:Transcript_58491/g.137717  ORF Transcript_58491/g.137717 Transcript_58491/m.137717 type:complete len:106 (-) Transcript_58491:342-659(-)